MVRFLKILVLHPIDWASGKYAGAHECEVRHVSIGGSNPTRLDGMVSRDGIGEKITAEGIEDLMRTAREFRPDVFLFGIHFGLTRGIVEAVRRASEGVLVTMHYTDQRDGIPKEVSQYGESIDLLLLTNKDKDDHEKYQELGLQTDTFYDGFNPKEYYPTLESPKYDAFFGGNNFAGLVRELKKRKIDTPPGIDFKGARFRERFILGAADMCKLKIRGNYGWADVGLKKGVVEPPVYHPEYLGAIRDARVILSTVNAKRQGLLTRRLWRSVASGRLYLTQYLDGMEEYFQDGVHLAWFKTVAEGLDKLRWYLEHGEERQQVANRGVTLLNSKHTYRHRLEEFKYIARRAMK